MRGWLGSGLIECKKGGAGELRLFLLAVRFWAGVKLAGIGAGGHLGWGDRAGWPKLACEQGKPDCGRSRWTWSDGSSNGCGQGLNLNRAKAGALTDGWRGSMSCWRGWRLACPGSPWTGWISLLRAAFDPACCSSCILNTGWGLCRQEGCFEKSSKFN